MKTALIATALVTTIAIAAPEAGAQDAARAAALEPGDAIRVTLSREPELSGEFTIDESGSAGLPILGLRQVTGIPPAELKRDLIAAYNDQVQNQAVQVSLLRRVRVLGEVNEPGLYLVDDTMTLGDAIALSGGATTTGNMEDIRVVRDGVEIESKLDGRSVGRFQSGDQIVVSRRSWVSRNSGVIIGAVISATGIFLSQL